MNASFASGKATLFQMLKSSLCILTVGPVVFLLAPYEFMPIGLYSVTHGTLHLTKGAAHAMLSSCVGWLTLAMYLLLIGIFIFAKRKLDRTIALVGLAVAYLLTGIGAKAMVVTIDSFLNSVTK